MFSLVRYLRDFGIDAELLLYDKELNHFLPDCDTLNNSKIISWIKKLSWGSPQSFFLTSSKKIKQDLESYNIIIGCGLLPAFLERARLKFHIFAPYGSDLYFLIFKKKYLLTWKMPAWLIFQYYQKKGIHKCFFSTII
ncbi:MAG: hypothetical protein DRM98_01910, partial [Thermoplasmata archaeon]